MTILKVTHTITSDKVDPETMEPTKWGLVVLP